MPTAPKDMMTEAQRHRSYYERRERQERLLATQAGSPEGRIVHRELTERYAALAHDRSPRSRLTIRV